MAEWASNEARELAEEHGIALEDVGEGSGTGGNVTVADVRAVVDERAEAEAQAEAAPPPVRVHLNPRLGSASHQFADGRVFYRDTSTVVSAEDFAELRKEKIGGTQVVIKEGS